MTSSLSYMLLSVLVLFDPQPHIAVQRLLALAELARQALTQWAAPTSQLAKQPFERVIYRASGPLEGLARAALKLLELTAGRIPVFANTPLGFRHGPKSALNCNTLLIMLRSVQPLARRYEQDLRDKLHHDGVAGRVLAIGPEAGNGDDLTLPMQHLEDSWLAPLWLLFAQIYAQHRSAALSLSPDNPFPNGILNRVAQGVTIHHA